MRTSENELKANWAIGLSTGSLLVSILMLLVTVFAYSEQVFGFFGGLPPHQAHERQVKAKQFAEAVASGAVGPLIEARRTVVEEGSSAQQFLDSLFWVREAVGAPHDSKTGTVVEIPDGWRACVDEDSCVEYTDFRFNRTGQIVTASRAGEGLESQVLRLGSSSSRDGVEVRPIGGRRIPEGGWFSYVLHVANKGDEGISVEKCLRPETFSGTTLRASSSTMTKLPVQIGPWQERNIRCDFQTTNNPSPQDVGLEAAVGEESVVLWVTFEP